VGECYVGEGTAAWTRGNVVDFDETKNRRCHVGGVVDAGAEDGGRVTRRHETAAPS